MRALFRGKREGGFRWMKARRKKQCRAHARSGPASLDVLVAALVQADTIFALCDFLENLEDAGGRG